ncbi:hypothetical protein ACFWF7_05830 [Nocardia sp. NPDC060256]|uniref:hypothetical protein n=1 Tax=unclassified Nocardia TaxID=2637762 RepID=UPI003657545D
MNSPEPIHDLARGDLAVSRQLSRALKVLLDGSPDPQLKNQIRGILEGKGSARDLMGSDAFNRVLDRTLPAAMQKFAEMPADERNSLAAQGEAELERLRNQPPDAQPSTDSTPPTDRTPPSAPADTVLPGTRKPNRDRIVSPDEPDEDDEYFQDRRQRGWLE